MVQYGLHDGIQVGCCWDFTLTRSRGRLQRYRIDSGGTTTAVYRNRRDDDRARALRVPVGSWQATLRLAACVLRLAPWLVHLGKTE